MSSRLLIFGWHNVDPTWYFPADGGRRGLERQLRLLRRVAHVVSLPDALARLTAGEPLPSRAVALTFDDGYRDNLDVAAPILHRLGLPATFFLVPEILSRNCSAWWEQLAWTLWAARRRWLDVQGTRYDLRNDGRRLDAQELLAHQLKTYSHDQREQAIRELASTLDAAGHPCLDQLFLDWNGARKLAGQGFTIGSHSFQHAILANESSEAQLADLVQSRQQLEIQLETSVSVLAYPNGKQEDYTQETLTAAASAGFLFALTTRPGWNSERTSPFGLRRSVVNPEAGIAGLAKKMLRAILDTAAQLADRPQVPELARVAR